MTTLILIVTCVNLLLASCVGAALITVLRISKRVRQLLQSASSRSVSELDAEVVALTSSFGSLSTTVKRLSSRYSIQERRERQKQGQLPANFDQLSPAERKAVLRAKIRTGELQVTRDDGSPITEV